MIKNTTITLFASLLITTAYADNHHAHKHKHPHKVVKKKVSGEFGEAGVAAGEDIGSSPSSPTSSTAKSDGYESSGSSSTPESMHSSKDHYDAARQASEKALAEATKALEAAKQEVYAGGSLNPANLLSGAAAKLEHAQLRVDAEKLVLDTTQKIDVLLGESERLTAGDPAGHSDAQKKQLASKFAEFKEIRTQVVALADEASNASKEVQDLTKAVVAAKNAMLENRGGSWRPANWSWFGGNGKSAEAAKKSAELLAARTRLADLSNKIEALISGLKDGYRTLELELQVIKARESLAKEQAKPDTRSWVASWWKTDPREASITAAQKALDEAAKAFRDSKEQKDFAKTSERLALERMMKEHKAKIKEEDEKLSLEAKHLAALSNNTNSEVEKLLARVKEMQEKRDAASAKFQAQSDAAQKARQERGNAIEAQRKKI